MQGDTNEYKLLSSLEGISCAALQQYDSKHKCDGESDNCGDDNDGNYYGDGECD